MFLDIGNSVVNPLLQNRFYEFRSNNVVELLNFHSLNLGFSNNGAVTVSIKL